MNYSSLTSIVEHITSDSLKPTVLTVKPRRQPEKKPAVLVFFQRCSLMEQTFTLSLTPTDSHLVFCCFDLLCGRPSLLFIFLYIQRCMWATWHCVIRWFLFWLSCVGEFSKFPQTGARWRDDTGSEESLQPVYLIHLTLIILIRIQDSVAATWAGQLREFCPPPLPAWGVPGPEDKAPAVILSLPEENLWRDASISDIWPLQLLLSLQRRVSLTLSQDWAGARTQKQKMTSIV